MTARSLRYIIATQKPMFNTTRQFMSVAMVALARRSWLWALVVSMFASSLVWAQADGTDSAPPADESSPSSIATQECPRNQCFSTVEARQTFARNNSCYFLEDVCTNYDPGEQVADEEDRGFWGSLWDAGVGAIQYGYEFVKGLFAGLGDQISDLIGLVTNAVDIAKGLIDLGKAFYEDPQGTIEKLGTLIGQELVDTFTRATQCGAYDLGRIVGQNINPAVVLKVASKLVKFGGRLDEAILATKIDFGCASFVSGTPVLTPVGSKAINTIKIGNLVLSRNEKTWTDSPQSVSNTFGRQAPSYRELTTEFETYRLTDEHPLWVQGKGWTKAQDITDDDVVASLKGDVRVKTNIAVAKPIQVYNFSVNDTPNYFVGEAGLWVHNATCRVPFPHRAPDSPSGYRIGSSDNGQGAWATTPRGDADWAKYETQITGAPENVEYQVLNTVTNRPVNFDGYDSVRDVLLDAKNYSPNNPLVKGFPPQAIEGITRDIQEQALRQIQAANGKPIEWHVSNQKAADAISGIFDADPALQGKIAVVFSPDVVN